MCSAPKGTAGATEHSVVNRRRWLGASYYFCLTLSLTLTLHPPSRARVRSSLEPPEAVVGR
eukprot:scaffold279115_cov15-Tisochrysis_lutea.AAC.1